MRSIIIKGPQDCRIEEEAEPPLTPGRIKVRIRYCSIVMENVGLYTGSDPRLRQPGNPLYRGYPQYQAGEIIADVVEVAPDVQGVQVGDRLATYAAYRETQVIAPDAWTKIHTGVPAEAAISQGFAGTTLHAVERARLEIGDDVLIIGAGPMGALLAPWSRLAGAGRIIVADLYPLRLEVARKLGATHTVNPKETDLTAAVQAITEGNGPAVVFDAGQYRVHLPARPGAGPSSGEGGRVELAYPAHHDRGHHQGLLSQGAGHYCHTRRRPQAGQPAAHRPLHGRRPLRSLTHRHRPPAARRSSWRHWRRCAATPPSISRR